MKDAYGYIEEKELGRPYDVKLLRRLYPFARPYGRLLMLSIVLVVLMTLLDLSVPYINKIAVDRYIVPQLDFGKGPSPRRIGSISRDEKIRYYRVALADPDTKRIVSKYRQRFEIIGETARIPYESLGQLDPEDLSVLRKKDYRGVGITAAALMGLILFNFGLNVVQVMVMEYTGQKIMHDIRLRLFIHIQSLSIAFFTKNPVGRLVTRVTNDVQNMYELFTSVIVLVFKDIFLLVGIAIVLLGINWKLALVSFSVLPFVLYASFRFSNLARDAFRILRIKIAEINTRLSETIGGIEVIQLFRLEKTNYRAFEKLNHENYIAGMQQIEVFAVFMPIIELLGSIAIAVVILYGGKGVLSESISLGALVAFISYMKMFFRPIRDIAEKYNVMQNAMASAERLFLIFDEKDDRPGSVVDGLPGRKSGAPALEKIVSLAMENISFGYHPKETVIKDISFRVDAGTSVALVGPTGAGKTTMIHLILRFYDPTSGRILINDRDIRDFDIADLRSKISLVMQEPFIFSDTVRNNILQENRHISEEKLRQIIRESNCDSLIDSLPAGLDTVLSEGGASISSGERQLLSIARAFARDPELILLDEATSYIDSETEQRIQSSLANLMKNRTSVLIAHRLSTARFADLILVINRGRIIESGSHPVLMGKKGLYFRLNQLENGFGRPCTFPPISG